MPPEWLAGEKVAVCCNAQALIDGKEAQPGVHDDEKKDGGDYRKKPPCVPAAGYVLHEVVYHPDDGFHEVLQAPGRQLHPPGGEEKQPDVQKRRDPGRQDSVGQDETVRKLAFLSDAFGIAL